MLDDSGRGGNGKGFRTGGGGGGGGACFTRGADVGFCPPHLITAHLLHLDFKCPIFQVLVYICYYCTEKN